MDQTNRKLLLVCDGMKFIGVISIGDVQRAILNKRELSLPVIEFIRKKVTYALWTDDLEAVKTRMRNEKIESMPIIDGENNLVDVIEWDQLFLESDFRENCKYSLPVVIMAGGKGTRLLPLTHIIPKAMIPISDKTIIEEIMSLFRKNGCDKFYVSVNYMKDVIKDYFSQKNEWNIQYLQEKKPLGTCGSLYLLKGKINSTFILSNCDSIIDINLSDLIDYHYQNHNIITMVSAIKKYHIPYGTIETEADGVIKSIKEKPDLVYQINSGFYVIEPEVLNYIEDEVFLNMTDLINKLLSDNKMIGAFPVSEGSWVDIGNWNEYINLVNKFYI